MQLSVLSLICAMFSFQLGASVAKYMFPVAGALGSTTLRLCVALVISLIIWRPWRLKWSLTDLKSIFLYGLFMGGMNLLFYLGIERVPLGICVGLEFIGPLAVALYASRKAIDFLWALLAGIGIFLLLPLTNFSDPLDPLGIIYSLGAGACWGCYIIYGKRVTKLARGGMTLSLGITVAGLLALPFGAHAALGSIMHDPSILALAFSVAMLSSVIPYALEISALKNMSAKTFGIFMSLAPAIASLIGALVLGEILTLQQVIAIACVVLASFGSSLMAHVEQSREALREITYT